MVTKYDILTFIKNFKGFTTRRKLVLFESDDRRSIRMLFRKYKGSVPSKSYNLMSYGIPSLYLASSDSQLHVYAGKYSHGKCFTKSELSSAVEFLEKLSTNKDYYNELSINSENASKDFRRDNADIFVEYYLLEKDTK